MIAMRAQGTDVLLLDEPSAFLDYLKQCSRAGVAQTPYQYATIGAEQPIKRLNRPGGGTGVIPNPTPVGDSIGCLLILAIGYTLVRCRRRLRKSGT